MVANSDMVKTLKKKSPVNKNTVLNAIPISKTQASAIKADKARGEAATNLLFDEPIPDNDLQLF